MDVFEVFGADGPGLSSGGPDLDLVLVRVLNECGAAVIGRQRTGMERDHDRTGSSGRNSRLS